MVLVFLGACGVLQLAAAHARLHGLLLLPRPAHAAVLGAALAAAGLLWFFGPGPRHVPDSAGGLDGNQQGGLFAMATLAALAFTVSATSVLNRRRLSGKPTEAWGLDALRCATYFQAMSTGVTALWRQWRERMRRRPSG